jgi:hypothetical protein
MLSWHSNSSYLTSLLQPFGQVRISPDNTDLAKRLSLNTGFGHLKGHVFDFPNQSAIQLLQKQLSHEMH